MDPDPIFDGRTIVVAGGDGFCGWPLALRASRLGADVVVVDNLARRKIDVDLGCDSLVPIASMDDRLRAWRDVTGRTITFVHLDLSEEFDRLVALLRDRRPHALVHYAEQRSAPYSMKSAATRNFTVRNNLGTTHNILSALVEAGCLDTHLVHLGTMGVYGYGAVDGEIPEGYMKATVRGEELEIPHPFAPGSVYHTTKCLDHTLFQFYHKNWGLRVTDLHQGIVWGASTEETRLHPDLANRLDYDSDYGTVLNRFVSQASIGHPLTVYGTGGQTRAFIHLEDSVRCIVLALQHPPDAADRVMVCNQMAECHTVLGLAQLVSRLFGAEVTAVDNPRKELADNDLDVSNRTFRSLGLDPILLGDGERLREIYEVARAHHDRMDRRQILPRSFW